MLQMLTPIPKKILIDTNLLLLFYIGIISEDLIPKFKRTKKYEKEDFKLLSSILSETKEILVTPNILTEVNNLANSLNGEYRKIFLKLFAGHIQTIKEHYFPSSQASQFDAFYHFGITDVGIIKVLPRDAALLTDDFALAEFGCRWSPPGRRGAARSGAAGA